MSMMWISQGRTWIAWTFCLREVWIPDAHTWPFRMFLDQSFKKKKKNHQDTEVTNCVCVWEQGHSLLSNMSYHLWLLIEMCDSSVVSLIHSEGLLKAHFKQQLTKQRIIPCPESLLLLDKMRNKICKPIIKWRNNFRHINSQRKGPIRYHDREKQGAGTI